MKHFFISLLILFPSLLFAQLSNVELEARSVPKPVIQDTAIANLDISQPAFTKLTPQAKEFLYWANYSRVNPKRFWDSVVAPILIAFPNLQSSYSQSLKTDLYQSPALAPFKLNATLVFTAQSHASDIGLKKGTPGHISTDGRSFADRARAAGIRYCGGENVSLGNVDPIMSLVLLYIDYGLPALGHRKALLNVAYTETGVGVSKYGDTDNTFIVEDFSCTQ